MASRDVSRPHDPNRSADLAEPEQRAKRTLLPTATTVHACTMEYRAPDLFFGNIEFGTDLDLWSAGCVVAEIWLGGKILFNPHNQDTAKDVGIVCRGHVALLGEPKGEARDWLARLPLWPFWKMICPGRRG